MFYFWLLWLQKEPVLLLGLQSMYHLNYYKVKWPIKGKTTPTSPCSTCMLYVIGKLMMYYVIWMNCFDFQVKIRELNHVRSSVWSVNNLVFHKSVTKATNSLMPIFWSQKLCHNHLLSKRSLTRNKNTTF